MGENKISTNLTCCVVLRGKLTPATIDLIQTPTDVTHELLASKDTKSIATAYLEWVDINFDETVYQTEKQKLICVFNNLKYFKFVGV